MYKRQLVFSANGNDVSDVFVNGNHVVDGGVLKTADIAPIMETVQQASETIARKDNYFGGSR